MVNLYDQYLSKAVDLQNAGQSDKASTMREAASSLSVNEYMASNTKKAIDNFNSSQYQSSVGGYTNNIIHSIFDGDKFPGSFGYTQDYIYVDYWTLRKRSKQLFDENPYCKGVIRRLLRNELNTGLNLEASPIGKIIDMDEDGAQELGDQQEIDFKLWQDNKNICDWKKQRTHGELAKQARMTAMITGDVLKVWHIDSKTQLPSIELIDGCFVQTPLNQKPRKGNRIVHGVEINPKGQHVAYWVNIDDVEKGIYKSKRIPVFGEKTGRRISQLIYGDFETKFDDVRGTPILAVLLYMIKELDRYRDSEQRAATVNSLLPMFVKKTQPGVGTQPIGGGAVRNESVTVTQPDSSIKNYNLAQMLPGTVMDELAVGEEPVSFNTQRPNTGYIAFEDAIINLFSWTLDIPPGIVKLVFQGSFSASRQANTEFSIYLKYFFKTFGDIFYQPDYEEYLIQSALIGDFDAPGFLEAWRDPRQWREFGAWVNAEWTGLSRPSVDVKKDVEAHLLLDAAGYITRDQICKKFSNMSFNGVTTKRAREKAQLEKIDPQSNDNQGAEPEPQNEILNAKMRQLELNFGELEGKIQEIEDEKYEAL